MKPHHYTPHDIGNRDDPHGQARLARSRPLLLHSLTEFREIFELVYTHRKIDTVVEIGVESGRASAVYAELGAANVFCVDPHPTDDMRAAIDGDPRLHLVQDMSPGALDELPVADLYVVDGDHNYATVRAELDWIIQHAPDAVIVLHDLLWPCSRRDFYYNAHALPADQRHPHTDAGPTIWHDGLTPSGFVGLGAFTWAEHAGGPRNGVLTAVEDALAAAPEPWHLELVPAVFGLGVITRATAPDSTALIEAVRPYSCSPLLSALENNRIALYTHVLNLQHEREGRMTELDQLVETVARHRQEIDHLNRQLDDVRQRDLSDSPAASLEVEPDVDRGTGETPSRKATPPKRSLAGLAADLAALTLFYTTHRNHRHRRG